jgi:alanine-synthesizing transaminase
MRATYKRRRDVLVDSGRAGWPGAAAARLDVRVGADPGAVRGARQRRVLEAPGRKAEVAVSPGTGFGERGEGFVRIALVENEQRIRQAARNIRRFLESAPEKLHNVVPLAKRG